MLQKGDAGTLYYMPPEFFRSEQATFAVDIWALGCIFHELMTGDVLFKSPDPSQNTKPTISKRILTSHPKRLPLKYSREFRHLVLTMLAQDPAMRPTAAEIRMTKVCCPPDMAELDESFCISESSSTLLST